MATEEELRPAALAHLYKAGLTQRGDTTHNTLNDLVSNFHIAAIAGAARGRAGPLVAQVANSVHLCMHQAQDDPWQALLGAHALAVICPKMLAGQTLLFNTV